MVTADLPLRYAGEDKIDKEEERRSELISRHTRIRPQQNQGINVSNGEERRVTSISGISRSEGKDARALISRWN